jgi:hypothetical protein
MGRGNHGAVQPEGCLNVRPQLGQRFHPTTRVQKASFPRSFEVRPVPFHRLSKPKFLPCHLCEDEPVPVPDDLTLVAYSSAKGGGRCM